MQGFSELWSKSHYKSHDKKLSYMKSSEARFKIIYYHGNYAKNCIPNVPETDPQWPSKLSVWLLESTEKSVPDAPS